MSESGTASISKYLIGTVLMLAAWWLLYNNLAPLAEAVTHSLSGITGFSVKSHLGSAIEFFIFETPKVLMLLTLVVFGVGIVRSFFTPERTRAILARYRSRPGHRRQGLALCHSGDRRGGRHPRICPGRHYGRIYGEIRLVVGSVVGRYRYSHVFKCCRNHSHCAGLA